MMLATCVGAGGVKNELKIQKYFLHVDSIHFI